MRLSLLPLISTLSPDLTRSTLIKVDSIISDIAEAFGTSELWSSLQYLRLESFLGMEPSTSQLQASDTAARVAIRQRPQIHVAPHGPPSPPTWVQFRHPAHNLTFLRLPALDYCPPTFGVHYGTAITACLILAWENELPDRTIVGCPSNWTAINERNKARDTQCLISESKDSLITSHVAARTDETSIRKMLVFDVGLLII